MVQLSRLAAVAAATALTLAATASAAFAADRYMATDGVDAGDCTSASAPCLAWEYVTEQAQDGDTIHLAAGTYGSDAFSNYGSGITKSLTIEGPQAGVPAPGRSGPEAVIDVTVDGSMFVQSGVTDVTFDGLTIAGQATSSAAFTTQSGTHSTIANMRIIGSGSVAVTTSTVTDIHGTVIGDGYTSSLSANAALTATQNVFPAGVTSYGALTATANTFIANGALSMINNRTTVVTGNRFAGSTAMITQSSRSVNGANNWYGCNAGANTVGCASVLNFGGSATVQPRLQLAAAVDPATIAANGTAAVRAVFRSSGGGAVPELLPPSTTASFSTSLGTLASATAPLGEANVLTAPSSSGDGTISATLDNQTVTTPFHVEIPLLSVDPADGDFADTTVGSSSAARSFTVENTSGAPIRVRSIALQGADADQFSLWANGCRTTLADGASCTMSAALTPTSPGAKAATIALLTDASADPVTVALSGTATATSTLGVSPASDAFGNVSIGGTSPRRTVTLTNNGATPLAINSITTAGATDEFVVSAGGCRTTLAPGATCTISSSFRPIRSGVGFVVITVRATGQPQQTVSLGGTGVGPALTIRPAAGAYGTVAVGASSSKRTFTVTNNGATSASVDIGSIGLTGSDADQFVLYAGGCANHSLAPDASCQISAYLRPTTVGRKSASISISAVSQPASTVALTGTATD